MAELFELVEGDAQRQAQGMGFAVVDVVSMTIQRIDLLGVPRYVVTRETLNADVLHREELNNCGLKAVTRSITVNERRQYGFSIDLDARLRGAATGMASLVEYVAVPTISSTTATQQLTLNLDLVLGSMIRGHKTYERSYTDNTAYELPPCSRTRIRYRVQTRTLDGTVEVDLRIIALVTLELRLVGAANAVTFPLPVPVDLRTTAGGRFAGLVADDMQTDIQQIACRTGACGALGNDQLGRLWGLEGSPAAAIPVAFEEEQPPLDVPEGDGKCYVKSHCTGVSYSSSYLECVADPIASSWKGPDGLCHEIRPDD